MTTTHTFEEQVSAAFGEVMGEIRRVETSLSERMDHIETQIRRVEGRIEGIQKQLDGFEHRVSLRFSRTEERFDELLAAIERYGRS